MCRSTHGSLRLSSGVSQSGSAMITAIFAITVLALLAVFLMRITWSQQDITTREVLSTRAWFAANSGSEWAMTRLFPLATDPANSSSATCSTSTTLTFTGDGLTGCSAHVTCNDNSFNADGKTVGFYLIESKGQCGNGQFSVSRMQEVWAKEVNE